jgi:hypothetical protein
MDSSGFDGMRRPETPIDKRPEAMRVWMLGGD